jgi:hypothetical protein
MALDLAGILKYWNWYPHFMCNMDHMHQNDMDGLTSYIYPKEMHKLASCVTTSFFDKAWTEIFNIIHLSCNKGVQVK